MKLWLDDVREPPLGWVWVKNVDDAIQCIKEFDVEVASLDHDLGWCDACSKAARIEDGVILNPNIVGQCTHVKTGYDLACWLEENPDMGPKHIIVHTVNPEGRTRMIMALYRSREVFVQPYDRWKGDIWNK